MADHAAENPTVQSEDALENVVPQKPKETGVPGGGGDGKNSVNVDPPSPTNTTTTTTTTAADKGKDEQPKVEDIGTIKGRVIDNPIRPSGSTTEAPATKATTTTTTTTTTSSEPKPEPEETGTFIELENTNIIIIRDGEIFTLHNQPLPPVNVTINLDNGGVITIENGKVKSSSNPLTGVDPLAKPDGKGNSKSSSIPVPPSNPPKDGDKSGGDKQPPDTSYLNNLQNDSDDIKRRKVIKERLINQRKRQKAENDALDVERLNDDGQTKHANEIRGDGKIDDSADSTDKFGKYVGYAGLGINTATSLVTDTGLGFKALGASELVPEASGWSDTMLKDNTTWTDATNGLYAVGNAVSGIGSGFRAYAQIKKAAQSRNRFRKGVSGTRAAGHILGTIASGAAMTSNMNNMGVFGDRATKEWANTREAGGWMDMTAGVAGLLKTVLDIGADAGERYDHGKVQQKADTIWGGVAQRQTHIDAISDAKQQIADANTNDGRKAARKVRDTEKAKFYAMQQASILHGEHTHDSVVRKNAVGALGALSGGFGAIANGVRKFGGGAGWGLAGSICGALGTGIKAAGAAISETSAKRSRARIAVKKREIVNEYLNKKKDDIQGQFGKLSFTDDEEDALGNDTTLSDDEAKLVAIMRLDINVPDDTDAVTPDMIDKAFEKITVKRAKNILKSEKTAKDKMLGALGFDDPDEVTLEDVVKALSGDF